MIKLGVNSVLFAGYDFETAVKHIALSGYDGVEISAIKGMCEHLELDRWKEQAKDLKQIVEDNGLEFLAMEHGHLDEERLLIAFEAAANIGIPVINVGPGGKSDVEEDIRETIDKLRRLAEKAEEFGVTICVKAHVLASIYNTQTTIRVMDAISSPGFGIDMDPSHVYRAGENPEEALPKVLSRVKHIHIRDCPKISSAPVDDSIKPGEAVGVFNTDAGTPPNQACGRGDIDLFAYCRAMVDGNYSGPVNLEVIGAGGLTLPEVSIIAGESYGYLNACLKKLGAR